MTGPIPGHVLEHSDDLHIRLLQQMNAAVEGAAVAERSLADAPPKSASAS
jgi:hypothetical protein